jgi:hypothetical protein
VVCPFYEQGYRYEVADSRWHYFTYMYLRKIALLDLHVICLIRYFKHTTKQITPNLDTATYINVYVH